MSHTPGPWKWWTSCSWRRLLNEDGTAHILQPTNSRSDGHPDIIVTDADMRLIEAAPILLEVLKLAEAYVGKGIAAGAYVGCARSGEWALERITTALSKAEGCP